MDRKLTNLVEKEDFEESARKQQSINSDLEGRVQQLELLLNRPDLLPQRDPQKLIANQNSDSG